jgi:hypothetical protein
MLKVLRSVLLSVTVFLVFIAHSVCAEVIVNYFHSTIRCETCLLIEDITGMILEDEFAEELEKGTLIWQPMDVDTPENSHFVKEFDLASNELLIRNSRTDGVFIEVPDPWKLINDYPKFEATLILSVQQALKAEANEKGSDLFF